MSVSRIELADEAEEIAAAMALQAATSIDELVSVWFRDCDAFDGERRERLQDVYAEKLERFAPMQRAG